MTHYVVGGWMLGAGPSGAERRLLSILREVPALLERGERVTVLHRPSALPNDAPGGLLWRPAQIPAGPTLRRILAERRVLPRLLEGLGAHLVELGALPVPRRLPCAVSLTLHDIRDLHGFRRRPRLLARRVLRKALRRVASVTVPSDAIADEARTAMGGLLPRLEVIPGGVDDDFLRTAPRPVDGERPYFLHVGHLENRKNLLMLLSAYAAFLESGHGPPDVRPALRLIGADHGQRGELAERAAFLDLTAHVHFDGIVSDSALRTAYARATAVLIPSLYEGFGLPALEGLAVGVPTVVADRAALPEVVGDVGQVLPADSVQAWAEAMTGWARTPLDAGAVRERKAHARRFRWRDAAERTLAAWRRAIVD